MILVRHAIPADSSGLIELRVALWPEDTEAGHAAEIARYFDETAEGPGTLPEAVLVAVAQSDSTERLVGFAELSRRPYAEGCTTSRVGFLEGWYVVPEYRRRGVGRALVEAGEAWARALGCREFASDTQVDNTASAAAHRALGFEEVEVIRCFRKDLGSA